MTILFFCPQSTHNACGQDFITAPVFARPDGIARKQATWLVAGKSSPRSKAASLLSCGGNIVDMGDDVGAANIVKLCGNFLIAVRNYIISYHNPTIYIYRQHNISACLLDGLD